MRKPDRQRQVVEAALELLADHRVEEVTTRAIARRVGITQPGIFRHFRSRDAIFVAVVEEVRARLAGRIAGILAEGGGLRRVEALAGVLVAQVERTPGIVRLLVRSLDFPDERAHAALAALVDTMRALTRQIVEEEARGVDAAAAGASFVALVQGTMLQWQLAGRPDDLGERMGAACSVWLAGVRAGAPAGSGAPEGRAEAIERLALGCLDARPILAAGRDPLEAILAALEVLEPDGALVLRAPFRPAPLIALLRRRGYGLDLEGPDEDCELLVRAPFCPAPLELRHLEAPEPLEQVLLAAERLAPGAVLLARVPRVPRLLLERLAERELEASAIATRDAGLVHLRRR